MIKQKLGMAGLFVFKRQVAAIATFLEPLDITFL